MPKILLRALVCSLPLALAACLAPTANDAEEQVAEQTSAPIVAGTPARSHAEAALVDMLQNGRQVAICSGAVIAPKVVLTAGHCVDGMNGWRVTTPYAGGQRATASASAVYDWKNTGDTVDPTKHDIGLVFLSTPINLSSYPKLGTTKQPVGTQAINIGRIGSGRASFSDLFEGQRVSLKDGASIGYPFDYYSTEIIESGDSGGPVELADGTIVAVNSGGGQGTQVLARVDLVGSWIASEIAAHGGAGGATPPPPPPPPPPPSCSGAAEVEPNDGVSTAKALGAATCGALATGADVDYFTFTVPAGGRYDVSVSPAGDGQVAVWKAAGGSYSRMTNNSPTRVAYTSTSGGSYVAAVWSPGAAAQSYRLTLTR